MSLETSIEQTTYKYNNTSLHTYLFELRPIQPTPVHPRHVGNRSQTKAMINWNEFERVITASPHQEIGGVAVSIQQSNIQDGNLLHFFDRQEAGRNVIHGRVIAVNKLLQGSHFFAGSITTCSSSLLLLFSNTTNRVRSNRRAACQDGHARSIVIKGSMPCFHQGCHGHRTHSFMIQQERSHFANTGFSRFNSLAQGHLLARQSQVSPWIGWCIGLFIRRFKDGNLVFAGIFDEVGSARSVQDEFGLEPQRQRAASFLYQRAQWLGRHIHHGRGNANVTR